MRRAQVVLASTGLAVALVGVTDAIAKAPDGRYEISTSAATVRDTKTKLTWRRDPMVPALNTLETARVTCPSGFRLPTIKEYETLVDESADTVPFVDTVAFPNIKGSDVFWSDTESNNAAADYSSFVFATDGTTKLVYYNGAGTSGLVVMCVQSS
jgi:hypothetical protein